MMTIHLSSTLGALSKKIKLLFYGSVFQLYRISRHTTLKDIRYNDVTHEQ